MKRSISYGEENNDTDDTAVVADKKRAKPTIITTATAAPQTSIEKVDETAPHVPHAFFVKHILRHTTLPIDIAKLIDSYMALYIYRIGGNYDDNKYTAITSFLMMNINAIESKRHWISSSPLSTGRSMATATLIDDRYIYVIGGMDSHYRQLSNVECFDVITGKWYLKPSLPQPRSKHCSAAVATTGKENDGKIFIIGGSFDRKNCLVYNPVTGLYWPVISMTEWRSNAAVVSFRNEYLYVFGGTWNTSCERYSIATSTWKFIAPLSIDRQWAQAVVLNDACIAIIGGYNNKYGKLLNDVQLYDVDKDIWTSANWKLPAAMNTYDNGFTAHFISSIQLLVVTSGVNPNGCWMRSLLSDDYDVVGTPQFCGANSDGWISLPAPASSVRVASC